MVFKISRVYDWLEHQWNKNSSSSYRSAALVFVFVFTLLISLCNYFHCLDNFYSLTNVSYTKAIEYTFNFLLFYEMISLAFVIPISISSAIARQFQIMSLIFLRTSFEELSNLHLTDSFNDQFPIIGQMAIEAGAALSIFYLTFWFSSLQTHNKIEDDTDREKFISFKKIIALGVLAGLLFNVFSDFLSFKRTGHFHPSYAEFYLILIFADMLLMLAAFRYVTKYPNIFRYSAYVLITIFIRIALIAPVNYNAIIGIGTMLFGIATAYIHNIYLKKQINTLQSN